MSDQIISKMKVRSASADILKAISILSVVYIHASYLIPFKSAEPDISTRDLDFLLNALRFCVPVFIFIWAYFAEKSAIKNDGLRVRSRLFTLFTPFLFWSLIYFVIIADFGNLNIGSVISQNWTGYGWSGQYYFIIIFQLLLLFPIVRKITLPIAKLHTTIFVTAVLFYSIITYSSWFNISLIGKLGYRPFFYWIPYVMLGIIAAHRNIFHIQLPGVIIILSPILILAEVYLLNTTSTFIYTLPSVFICTMILCSTIQSTFGYSQLNPLVSNIIQSLASSTLGIFCLNPLVIISFSALFQTAGWHLSFPLCTIIVPAISAIATCVICLLLIKLLKAVRLGAIVAN